MPRAAARGPVPVGRRGPGQPDGTPTPKRNRPEYCTCPDCVAEFGERGQLCSTRTGRRHWARFTSEIDVACAPEPDPNLPALEDHESDSDDAWSDDDLDGSDVCDVEADASAPATRPPIEDMPDYTGIGPAPAPRSAAKHCTLYPVCACSQARRTERPHRGPNRAHLQWRGWDQPSGVLCAYQRCGGQIPKRRQGWERGSGRARQLITSSLLVTFSHF